MKAKIATDEDEIAGFSRRWKIVERAQVELSKNYIRRKHILGNVEQVYVANLVRLIEPLVPPDEG